MSLFDDDLVTKDFSLPKFDNGGAYTNEDIFNKVQGLNTLWKLEREKLHKFYQYNVYGEGLINLMDTLLSREEIQVEISAKQPECSGTSDHPIDPYQTQEGKTIILGEYCAEGNSEKITLYIRNIRWASKENKGVSSSLLLLSVFAHELYHAFFHKSSYCPKLEEPMAEFGSLLYMNMLRKTKEVTDKGVMALCEMVSSKKEALKHYSAGAILFQLVGMGVDASIIYKFKCFDMSRIKASGDRCQEYSCYSKSLEVNDFMKVIL